MFSKESRILSLTLLSSIILLSLSFTEGFLVEASYSSLSVKSFSQKKSCVVYKKSFGQIDQRIQYETIVKYGLSAWRKNISKMSFISLPVVHSFSLLYSLEKWYDSHPMIEFATLVETTITIRFVDGTYVLLIDPLECYKPFFTYDNRYFLSNVFSAYTHGRGDEKDAVVLNPSQYLYGRWHCQKIMDSLSSIGYNVMYRADEYVDLGYIENNLTAEIIYMNTHAGYWDIDGDGRADTVVIATGEKWSNETVDRYRFEYENKMIVRGMVGEICFVAFTPALIKYCYESVPMPGSLVYMATCHAAYDDSMAKSFLSSGASVYIGWSRNTFFWTNSLSSIVAFKLLCRGFTVERVCRIVGYGGICNFLFRSKLTYYGKGDFRIVC